MAFLSDNFNASERDAAKWDLGAYFGYNPAVAAEQINGRLRLTPLTDSTGYGGYVSRAVYDFTGQNVSVELVDAGNMASTAYGEFGFFAVSNKYCFFLVYQNVLYFRYANGDISDTSVAYNAATHKFLRLAESGGSVSFQTSADGSVWTTQRTVDLEWSVTTVKINLTVGTFGVSPNAAPVAYDNFASVLPLAAPSSVEDALDARLQLNADFQQEDAAQPPGGFAANINLDADFQSEAFDQDAFDDFASGLEFAAAFNAAAAAPGDDFLNLELPLSGEIACDTELALNFPPPITRTVSINAFQNQRYAGGGGRLFINSVLTSFTSARISAPAGSLGFSLSIELASADLAQLPPGAVFKFEIGKIVFGAPVWTTILDGGKLSGRTFQVAVGRDSLNFSTFEIDSKLNKYPKNNLIVFDSAKTNVSEAEIEPLPTNTNETITTATRSVSVLTLYKLLQIAFVEGCGFGQVSTDIPNYEIARCDFSVVNSYSQAVAQFIGMYEPVMSVAGNALTIQKTVDPLPLGFLPNVIQSIRYPRFQENLSVNDSKLDGYILNYTATSGSSYFDRNLPDEIIPSGKFGEPDFTETTVARKMRDWYETGESIAVRSELKQEVRTTRRNGITVGREIRINAFDRLGRAAGYTNTIFARMPDVNNDGSPALLKTKEDSQKISYKSNPFAPRQTVLSKVETSSMALLAIDAENLALDENGNDSPYAQNYERVFEAGNLKKDMTSAFQTLETTIEHFRPQANGQIEVRVETFDALRGKLKPQPSAEIRSGDVSVPNFSKQKTKTIFRAGVNQTNRNGKLETLNVGELPLFFAEDLADWKLSNPRITAQVELAGFDESIERGVSFNLRGRENADLGNFLTRGFEIVIEPERITTTLEALKV